MVEFVNETLIQLLNGKITSCLSPSIFVKLKNEVELFDDSNYSTIFNSEGIGQKICNDHASFMLDAAFFTTIANQIDHSIEDILISLEITTLIEKTLFTVLNISTNSPRSKFSGILLKDLLFHDTLILVLPSNLLDTMRWLFLPTGVNLRNLLWHGFLASSELNKKYVKLLASILCQLLAIASSIDQHPNPSTHISSVVMSSVYGLPSLASLQDLETKLLALPLRPEFVSLLKTTPSKALSALAQQSVFVLTDRLPLILAAVEDLQKDEPVKALLRLLPLLEQGLRLLFSAANRSPSHLLAHHRRYYTTLDGFGQRSKHQLLLDPLFRYQTQMQTSQKEGKPEAQSFNSDESPPTDSSGASFNVRTNELPALLGPGLYAILVDLFLAEAGPSLRARLSHGGDGVGVPLSQSWMHLEEDMSTRYRCRAVYSRAGYLILSIVITLCWRFPRKQHSLPSHSPVIGLVSPPDLTPRDWTADTDANNIDPVGGWSDHVTGLLASCSPVLTSHVSAFHPHSTLHRRLRCTISSLGLLTKRLCHRVIRVSAVPVKGGGGSCKLSVDSASLAMSVRVGSVRRDSYENREGEGEGNLELTVTEKADRFLHFLPRDSGSGKASTLASSERAAGAAGRVEVTMGDLTTTASELCLDWLTVFAASSPITSSSPSLNPQHTPSPDIMTGEVEVATLAESLALVQRIGRAAWSMDLDVKSAIFAASLKTSETAECQPFVIAPPIRREEGCANEQSLPQEQELLYLWSALDAAADSYLKERLGLLTPIAPQLVAVTQIVEVCQGICEDVVTEVSQLEAAIACGKAHTAQRRRYLTLVLSLQPVCVSVVSLALALVFRYLGLATEETGESKPSQSNDGQPLRAADQYLQILNGFAICLSPSPFSAAAITNNRDDAETADSSASKHRKPALKLSGSDKKAPDRSLHQLVNGLRSRATTQAFSVFRRK